MQTVRGIVVEAALATITAVLRDLFGASWGPSEVYLPRRLPEDRTPYNTFFRASVRFNEEVAALAVAVSDLDRSVSKARVTEPSNIRHQMVRSRQKRRLIC